MIRIGLLGAGGMGNVHARHYRNIPDVELMFWERDPDKLEAFTKRWDIKPAGGADDLFAWADAIDVCLPTDLHLEVGQQAIAAGKGLFIEKPAAKTFEDALGLWEASQQAGTQYMVGHVVRYFPEFAQARQAVVNGDVGTPGVVRTRRGGLAPTGSEGWFQNHARSGGVLLDLAIHDFDWLRWTLGEVVSVNARSIGIKAGHGPDYALTVLKFANDAIAHVESTWMDPAGFRTTFEICGSKGIIEFDSRNTATLRSSNEIRTEAPLAPEDDPYYKELSAFVNCIRTDSTPPITGLDGAIAVGIALTAIESAKQDRPLKPPRV